MAKNSNLAASPSRDEGTQSNDTIFNILQAQERLGELLQALAVEQRALQAYLEKRLSEDQITQIIQTILTTVAEQVGGEFEERLQMIEKRQGIWEREMEAAAERHAQMAVEVHVQDEQERQEIEKDITDRITRSKTRG